MNDPTYALVDLDWVRDGRGEDSGPVIRDHDADGHPSWTADYEEVE